MPVTNTLVCGEAILTTAALTAASTEIVADPGSTGSKRVNLYFCNTTGSDVTVDIARVVGGVLYRIALGWKVPANDTRIMENVALTNGRTIRARASNAAAIEVTIDAVTRTET